MQGEKQIVLAFFDILGTSKMLNNGNYQTVYDYYDFMAKLCSDTHTPIAVVNHMYGLPKLPIGYSNAKYIIINYDLNHCFFSDTFLLWIEVDSFLQPTLAGFLEKCCIVFCEAIKREIPLRGVISAGTAVMDKNKHLYIGKPLAEAAKAEPQQNWLGIGLGKSIQKILPLDMEYVLPYFKHIKNRDETLLGEWVLDWPYWWRRNEETDVTNFINTMNKDVMFDRYYSNSLSFVEISEHRDNIWNIFMIFQDMNRLSKLLEMDKDISDKLKGDRKQGIEIFTSQKMLDFVHSILMPNNDWIDKWLDQNDKEILINLQNGFIPVNGKPVLIDKYKE